jgi:hypothetical protein
VLKLPEETWTDEADEDSRDGDRQGASRVRFSWRRAGFGSSYGRKVSGVRFELGNRRPPADMVAALGAIARGHHVIGFEETRQTDHSCPPVPYETGLVRVTSHYRADFKHWTGLESVQYWRPSWEGEGFIELHGAV